MQEPPAIPTEVLVDASTATEGVVEVTTATALDLLNSYSGLFVAAFVVTLLATPIVRSIALSLGVIDRPDLERKNHDVPVPYLGGVAVFLGLAVALGLSFVLKDRVTGSYQHVPIAVMLGMVAVLITGLADDLWGWDPRLKIAGQLVAAAALAINNVGVLVAQGLLQPFMGPPEEVLFSVGQWFALENADVYYWVGTALIAVFVLGGCNSANLLDGLDGLLPGVVAIVVVGLLAISLLMMGDQMTILALQDGEDSLAGARVVLCVALLGAVLGFLPHNFRPASIFLGDSGSLLIGYVCAVIILMLGEHGQTHLVFAGLIVFAVPIIDTTLAIIRRRLAGTSMSAADDQHLHHQLCRSLGGVRRAVLALYGISALFAILGVVLAWLVISTQLRVRVIYAVVLVVFSFIGVTAFKAGRVRQRQVATGRSSAPMPASPPEPPKPTTAAGTPGTTSHAKPT